MPHYVDINTYNEHCNELDRRITNYLWMPKAGYQTLDCVTAQQRLIAQSKYLHANNLHARKRFAEIYIRHISAMIDEADSDIDLRFVTLTPDIFAVPLATAAQFKMGGLRAWVETALAGYDFIGMAEPAYYLNWPNGQPTISFHAHVVVFGANYRRLLQDTKPFRQKFQSLVPGIHSIHTQYLAAAELMPKLLYMNKFPYRGYVPSPVKKEMIDLDTGEIEWPPKGRLLQSKPPLRPGQLVTMCKVLSGQCLDHMVIAGGSCTATAKAVRREARAAYRPHKKRSPSQLAALVSPPVLGTQTRATPR